MYRPDEDIDRLSREAAEHYHTPGKPDWDALRSTLDKELPQEQKKKRRGFLFFILLGLGLTLAGGMLLRYNTKNHSTPNGVAATAENSNIPAASTTVLSQKANGISKNTNNHIASGQPADSTVIASAQLANTTPGTAAITSLTSTPHEALTLPNTNPQGAAAGQQAAVTEHSVTSKQLLKPITGDITTQKHTGVAGAAGMPFAKTANHSRQIENTRSGETVHAPNKTDRFAKHSVTFKRKNTSVKDKPAGSTKADNDLVVTDTDASSGAKDIPTKSAIAQTPPPVDVSTADRQLPVAAKDNAAKQALPAIAAKKDSVASTVVTKEKNKSKKSTAILLGITGGLDLSMVKFTYGSSVGYNIGFTGGYQFSPHWSAYTGVIYTKKNYKLNGSDYHPPKHYWTQYVQLETVDGYCRMWEVPLLLRYTVNPAAKTAFFASAGLSSYFMKKQQYDYYYKNSAGVALTMPWSNDSTFNHVFSILDLSVGVQKKIGKHMDWQIEPYAKIPLGGVGFGNIRLSSFGVNLTVQYRQPLKR